MGEMNTAQRTVAGGVNVVGQLRYGHGESRLDCSHHLLVAVGGDEGDGKTFGPESSRTTRKR
jgi:hypothetical protein